MLLVLLAWAGRAQATYYVAEYDDENNRLTFRASETAPDGTTSWDATDTGTDDPKWSGKMYQQVVFDESFAAARPASCFRWFYNSDSPNDFLLTITGLEHLNTSEVTTMQGMFYGQNQLVELDLSTFDTGKVTDMSYMFFGCNQLKAIYVGPLWATGQIGADGRTKMFESCPVAQEKNMTFCSPVSEVDGFWWGTYYASGITRQADNQTTVYAARRDEERLTLMPVTDRVCRAGEGYILRRATEGPALLRVAADATSDDAPSGELGGVDLPSAQEEGYTYYVLSTGSDGLGFYRYREGNQLGAHKAFLRIQDHQGGESANVRAYPFDLGLDATVITSPAAPQGTSVLKAYDLMGRSLPIGGGQKGIRIIGGRKYMIR